jgi:DNA-binding transcriptional LysR family regulator
LTASITPERYAACKHVVASRKGSFVGPVDAALEEIGLTRKTVVVVPGFSDAMRIARQSDLIALVPASCLDSADPSMEGLSIFPIPVRTPDIAVTAMWHPRLDADPGHRWLREIVVVTCRPASRPDLSDA